MSEENSQAPDQPQDERTGDRSRRGKRLATGLAFGIGSAAIVAALLYANRSKKDSGD